MGVTAENINLAFLSRATFITKKKRLVWYSRYNLFGEDKAIFRVFETLRLQRLESTDCVLKKIGSG